MYFGDNIRYFRTHELNNMSRKDFGESLGVSADVINNIERNRLAHPEKKEPLLRLICETYHVNYDWLTKNEGKIYTKTKQLFFEKVCRAYGLDFYSQKILGCYLNLPSEQRDIVDCFFKSISDAFSEPSPNCGNENSEIAIDIADVHQETDVEMILEREMIPDESQE